MTSTSDRVFTRRFRTQGAPAGHSESTAAFLDRVAGGYWDEVRDLIESWVLNLPGSARADVIGRLRSPNFAQFAGAFWELYLHETFVRSGFAVSVHPVVPETSGHPDFLVTGDGESFYVEAKALVDKGRDKGAAARRSRLYDALDKIHCPNFFLQIDVNQVGAADLRTKELRGAIEEWLASLDPDSIVIEDHYYDLGDRLSWSAAGWELEFRPIPVKQEARGKSGHRPLGIFGPIRVAWINDDVVLRTALAEKGSAYGELDHSLVIAINNFAMSHDNFDTMNALYGTEQLQISLDDRSAPPVRTRARDGYWHRATWAHQHVAGVVLGRSIMPWRVSDAVPTYWQHPEPSGGVTPLPAWHVAEPVINHIEFRDPTASLAELFGLPSPWPTGTVCVEEVAC